MDASYEVKGKWLKLCTNLNKGFILNTQTVWVGNPAAHLIKTKNIQGCAVRKIKGIPVL